MLQSQDDLQAKHAAEERFRSLVEQIPAVTYTESLGDTGAYTYVSPQVETLLGYTPAEIIGNPDLLGQCIHPGDRDRVRLEGERTTATGDPLRMEYRVLASDGRWVHLRDEAVLVRDDAGNPLHWQGVLIDLTERRRAESAPRESEERFRSAFDHAPIGLAIVSPDGQFRQVNRSLCDIVGYSEHELLGKTFQEITHPDDLADDLAQARRLWSGAIDTYQLEKRYFHKDGHAVWIQLTVSAVRDDDGPVHAIAQIQDISSQRHLDLERATMLASEREYTRQLRELAEMRTDLTAMIAHELRSPVAALRMMTTMLETGELAPAAAEETLASIRGQIDQLDRLVSDVAASAAAERDQFSMQFHPVSLAVLLDGAAAFAQTSLRGHAFSVAAEPHVKVWCDPERISQVLRNLLDNAAKHTPPGTPVAVMAPVRENRVRIEVANQGPAIPPDDLALMFEKFGRGREAAERKTVGAGLGLYVSRRIVEAHGGELTVESTPERGTIFGFALKIVS